MAAIAGVLLTQPLRRQAIETGVSNDDFTEIKSGLKEGDMVVVRTIDASASASKTQQSQSTTGIKIPGLNSGGGGAVRTEFR